MSRAIYKCPFCKTEIEDGIDALREHRKDGGECDKLSAKIFLARMRGFYENKYLEWVGPNFDPEARDKWVNDKLREEGWQV